MSDRTELDLRQPAGKSDPTSPSAFGNDETEDGIGGDRDPLDRLAEKFVDRARRGESPSISEYEARFPDQAEKIRKLLGAVAMMEQLRRGSKQARFLPERIGEFRVLRELGRGGMGVVYEAVQESLWRHVAVKAIHHTQLDSKRLQRFQREAQAVARLHHTNIVPIFGVGEHDGVPYYAMQYIKGRGLDAVLESWRNGLDPRPRSPASGRPLRVAGGRGARPRPRARGAPPRRQAGEPSDRRARRRLGHRLRPGQAGSNAPGGGVAGTGQSPR